MIAVGVSFGSDFDWGLQSWRSIRQGSVSRLNAILLAFMQLGRIFEEISSRLGLNCFGSNSSVLAFMDLVFELGRARTDEFELERSSHSWI